ncbi:MAG: hypothetical protein ACLUEK_11085 [Oscillospiraceae bacterium]
MLRAMHFSRTTGAPPGANALSAGIRRASGLVRAGRSSWELLQNITPTGAVKGRPWPWPRRGGARPGGRGACRVHGGGFAGTIQAFVPWT